MKKFIPTFLILVIATSLSVFAQDDMPPHIKDHITYPVLDFHPWVGVLPVENPAMTYDSDLEYKIAIDMYGRVKDSTAIHSSFLEVARTYNLNITNGVPPEKIKIAAVIHGGLVQAILSEEKYKEKYTVSNPNLMAIKALEEVGVKFYVCGQSVGFNNIPAANITPMVKLAISAKTTFITLDQLGYSYLNVSED